jgi:hypothetical protein
MDICHRSGNRDSVAGQGVADRRRQRGVGGCVRVGGGGGVFVCVWEGGHLHTNWQSIDAIMTRMATPCQKPSCWLLGIAANPK